MPTVIGVDFDNTVVSYDDVFHDLALERGLITPDTKRLKNEVRNEVRRGPDGEGRWQELQGIAYGAEMDRAKLLPGVTEFFSWCRETLTPVYIVSHKTENLRASALGWIQRTKLFPADQIDCIFFEATRREKVERIRALGCTHFIDDLEEVFLEPAFPPSIRKILFSQCALDNSVAYDRVTCSWKEINHFFVGK